MSLAALNRNALDYHLQLSVVLEGPRGVGKTTTVGQVARRLGMHLLEVKVFRRKDEQPLIASKVDCYEVVSDSDVKTEGTLRAKFDKAASCSPCIVLLRHIDALTQTTQSLEPGKGSSS